VVRLNSLEDADFSDEFCHFLQGAVPTVDAAELLLRLKGDAARWWIVGSEALRYVEAFQASGLVATDADRRVRYQPASEAAAAHAETLQKVYRERPVTLFRVIYGLRDSKIRSFAEAFKLRRK
jgi:hypothetical protein